MKIFIPLITLACLLSGCVDFSGHLNYPNVSLLKLGKTRNTDYAAIFGKPFSVEEKSGLDGNFELIHYQQVIKYVYLTTTYRYRSLDLEFHNGVLNAYYFISTLDDEKTKIDFNELNKIKQGSSNKNDVLGILGKPNGMAFCPSFINAFKDKCNGYAEIWEWERRGEEVVTGGVFLGDPIEKHIIISFDKNGFVANIEFSQKKKL